MLTSVKPMLATLVDRPLDRAGWIFEIKWNGYRILAELDKGHVRLYYGLSFTERYRGHGSRSRQDLQLIRMTLRR
jgi:bifunctional non-homologous end joining protein LigD